MKKLICVCIVVLFSAVPAIADIFLEKAKKEIDEENYRTAQTYIEQSLDANPGNIQANFLLADTYCAREKFKTAIKIYSAILKKDPENIEALDRLGHVYFAGEFYRDAIGIFEEVLAAEPENIHALYTMGMSHALSMDLDKGYTIYRQLKKKNEKLAKKLLHQLQGHLT